MEEEGISYVRRGEQLTSIPSKVLVMSNITHLDLSHNQIEVVPEGLFPNLTRIVKLELNHNSIHAFPSDIRALQELTHLALDHNSIILLPESICDLSKLEHLELGSNRIRQLPSGVDGWKSLLHLGLRNNDLQLLPRELGWLQHLEKIALSGNMKLSLPKAVHGAGCSAILSYLQLVGEQHAMVERHVRDLEHTVLRGSSSNLGGGSHSSIPDLALGLRVSETQVPETSENKHQARLARRMGLARLHSVAHLQSCSLPDLPLEQLQELDSVQVLNLGHNKLKHLARDVLALPGLAVLDASHNRIKDFLTSKQQQQPGAGAAAASSSTVAVLNLSFNKLKELPEDLGTACPALQQLYVASNRLSSLPASLAATPLAEVFASENCFPQLPPVLLQLGQLLKLSLAACELRELPEDLTGLSELRFLDLSFNFLKALPDAMVQLQQLQALGLSHNPLGTFPEVLGALTGLRELNLDRTGITSFPEALGRLAALEALQLEGCPLEQPLAQIYAKNPLLLVPLHAPSSTSLDLSHIGLDTVPMQLSALTSLTSLELNNNKIKDIPLHLARMTTLKALQLKFNPLRPPFDAILETRGALAMLPLADPEVATVDLADVGLTELPQDMLLHREHAQQMKLSGNRFTTLPQALTGFSRLAALEVDNNFLESLPEPLLHCPALSILIASGNIISHLPRNFGPLDVQLEALVLHDNQLSSLPESIGSLKALRVLCLSSNRLTSLPDSLGACASLALLDVSYNLLADLPDTLGDLGHLRTLKAEHNQLEWLPAGVCRLSSMQELCVEGNMLEVNLPLTAVGRSACMQLLQALLPLVVGWGEASSLPGSKKQLQSQAPGAQPEASSTAAGVAPAQQAAGSSPAVKQHPAKEQTAAGSTAAAAAAAAGSTAAASAAQASSRPGELAMARASAEEHASEAGETRWSIASEEQRWDMPTGVSITGWDSLHLGDVTKLLAVLAQPPAPPSPDLGPGQAGGSPGAGDGEQASPSGGKKRPQNAARFARIAQQTNTALALLQSAASTTAPKPMGKPWA